jgi:hypothetical protein
VPPSAEGPADGSQLMPVIGNRSPASCGGVVRRLTRDLCNRDCAALLDSRYEQPRVNRALPRRCAPLSGRFPSPVRAAQPDAIEAGAVVTVSFRRGSWP